MIILGLDPGSTRIGFGLISIENGKYTCLGYGAIETPKISRGDDLQYTVRELTSLIEQFKPSVAVIEKLFFTKNQKTAMAVSETRGILLLTCAQHRIPVQEVTPMQVKQAVAGYGSADKRQMQDMVRRIFRLTEEVKPDDAADALALALCCVTSEVDI